MSNVFNARQTGPISAVALAPVNDSYYADFTLEPAMVRIRAQNHAALYCSSSDAVIKNVVPNDVVVGTPGDGILMRKVKRLALRYVKFQTSTNIINSSNNELLIFCAVNSTVYRVTIPTGYWNTPQLLITALRTGILNAVLPVSFSYLFKGSGSAVAPSLDNQVTIIASGPVYILSECSAVKYGGSTYGFPVINGPAWDGINPVPLLDTSGSPNPAYAVYNAHCWTTMKIGSMPCVYSRYVDIFSRSLTKWTKIPSTNTKSPGTAFIYRLFLDTFNGYAENPGIITVAPPATPIIYLPPRLTYLHSVPNPIFFTLNPDENISTIALEFRDEYGRNYIGNDPIIIREAVPGDPATIINSIPPNVFNGGVSWDLAFTAEI